MSVRSESGSASEAGGSFGDGVALRLKPNRVVGPGLRLDAAALAAIVKSADAKEELKVAAASALGRLCGLGYGVLFVITFQISERSGL